MTLNSWFFVCFLSVGIKGGLLLLVFHRTLSSSLVSWFWDILVLQLTMADLELIHCASQCILEPIEVFCLNLPSDGITGMSLYAHLLVFIEFFFWYFVHLFFQLSKFNKVSIFIFRLFLDGWLLLVVWFGSLCPYFVVLPTSTILCHCTIFITF